jgi:fructose/tagatose bisphosphate aldolase
MVFEAAEKVKTHAMGIDVEGELGMVGREEAVDRGRRSPSPGNQRPAQCGLLAGG